MENMEKVRIFIGCLPPNADREELHEYFSSFCQISEFKLKYRSNKQCAGFGNFQCLEKDKVENLINTPHFHKRRSIEVRLYLSGDKLKEYQKSFNKRRLYVGNLPNEINDEELYHFFQKVAPVDRAYTLDVLDQDGNRFGFVVFKSESTLELVKSQKLIFKGRNLDVKMMSKDKNAHKRKKNDEREGNKKDDKTKKKVGEEEGGDSIHHPLQNRRGVSNQAVMYSIGRGFSNYGYEYREVNFSGQNTFRSSPIQGDRFDHSLTQVNTIRRVLVVSKSNKLNHNSINIRLSD